MTPQQHIKSIIKENKLVDAAEISDLEMLRDQVYPKLNNPSQGGTKIDIEGQRRLEILTKILSWIK